jgi:hypothetical protein
MKQMKSLLNKIKKFFQKDTVQVKNKTYKICTEQEFYVNDKTSIVVELISGKYKDVVVGISTIHIKEILDDGSAEATFDMEIYRQPKSMKLNLIEDAKFNTIVCDILLQLLEEATSEIRDRMNQLSQESIEDSNEIRNDGTDYFEESVQKRTVRKKDPTIPKKRIFSRKKR